MGEAFSQERNIRTDKPVPGYSGKFRMARTILSRSGAGICRVEDAKRQ